VLTEAVTGSLDAGLNDGEPASPTAAAYVVDDESPDSRARTGTFDSSSSS